MGIRGILKELPGGDARTCQRTGFEKLDFLSGDKRLHADIDAMTLEFVVAIRHKEAFNRRIYAPSAADFQRQIVVLKQVHKWDFTLIFDVFGGDSEKWGKLNNPEFASARQLAPLFEALEKSQTADDSDSDASDDDDI